MRVLVISDTHGRCGILDQVFREAGEIDCVIHCGDVSEDEKEIRSRVQCPVLMVAGNNDFFTDLPKEIKTTLAGNSIFICHGHRQRVSFGMEGLYFRGLEENAGIVLFGHTHRPMCAWQGGMLIANPGSLSQPRQAGWHKTYMVLELEEGKLPRAEIHVPGAGIWTPIE